MQLLRTNAGRRIAIEIGRRFQVQLRNVYVMIPEIRFDAHQLRQSAIFAYFIGHRIDFVFERYRIARHFVNLQLIGKRLGKRI